MPTPILATKLFVPSPPPHVVARPRLRERLKINLRQGGHSTKKLTLVSAPAGFGKTTLVSEMVAENGRPVAWLSLDESDNDPVRFLTYLVAALQSVVGQSALNFGHGVWDALQSPQPPPIESLLTALLNEISTFPDHFVLVLDDYHLIDARPVDDILTFLLEHQPPQLHLVITTREDPQLPLPRLRARGQLTELRAADLRFTAPEAAEFLNSMLGLNLSAEEITILEGRTEGWIAGLQLAALAVQAHLSLEGTRDVQGFIREFAGDHRYIVDYLIAEVLERQPEPVRRFLLETAILERLNGSLCDAVTGQSDGSARLAALERGNFFVVPLDDKRQWYRYHHLFAHVLSTHLVANEPNHVPMLHQRASEWYERNGLRADAVRHALAAKDFERAADLIERALPAMLQSRQEATLIGWLQALPDELFHNRPVLAIHFAGTLLQNGQLDGVESRLRDVERWLAAPEDIRVRPVYVNEEGLQRLPGSVAMYHAGIAQVHGDVVNTMKYAQRALELAREDDYFLRGGASALLGLAYWASGDLEAAHQTYADGMSCLQKIGHVSDVVGGSIAMADIRITQGRLCEAMSTYERGLELATSQELPPLRGAADMHVGMSELYRERNELDTAVQHILTSKELGELNGLPKNPYRSRIAMARIKEARGDLDGAIDLLNEAERLYVGDFAPNARPVPALRARVWVVAGRLGQAVGWARETGVTAGDEVSYLREFEHITLARLLLAQYRSDRSDGLIREAMDLLERLEKAAEAGGRLGSLIEILVLQALAHQIQNDIPFALTPLERALRLAEPEGYVRIFLDEGQPMAQLLVEAAARRVLPDYTRKLLAAFKAEEQKSAGEAPIPGTPASQRLPEPLSDRELEILRLFKTELSGPEIADELVIALSTVRFHTKNIYSKLNVNSRRAAVQRAVELDLL